MSEDRIRVITKTELVPSGPGRRYWDPDHYVRNTYAWISVKDGKLVVEKDDEQT